MWMWEAFGTGRAFWACVVLFRLWNALFVRTYFNPDEFWQSTEVAHRMVFGYGYLTWEWQEGAQIRGYAHPSIFALLYQCLAVLQQDFVQGLDSRWAVAYSPRLLHGLVAAGTDYFTFKLANVYFDRTTARWTLLCQLCSWFIFYVMVRTYSNSLETLCTVAAMAYWPWSFKVADANKKHSGDAAPKREQLQADRVVAVCWAALGVLIRPTNAVLWVFLGMRHFWTCQDRTALVFRTVLPIALVMLVTMVAIDRIGYGTWVFVPFNFVRFNVLEGKDRLYGVHRLDWYFTEGFPAITATSLPFFLVGQFTAPRSKRELAYVIWWTMLVYSKTAHKEFRFVLPLLPAAHVYAGFCIRNLAAAAYTKIHPTTQRRLTAFAIFLTIVPNAIASVYLSRWHQRGPLEVIDFLAQELEVSQVFTPSIHFWTSCHDTPYYSHLHKNVSMWFPDCSPENRERPEGCESHQLDRDPVQFLTKRYDISVDPAASDTHGLLPDYVVAYSSIASRSRSILTSLHYTEVASFFHSHVSGDADIEEHDGKMFVFRRDSG
ncbi:TPA: hypothetical protein N0F65_000534 [Lagenidium giganteum]|uniref:Mannosyltransferase n=1 Tax=Lagenidium giganteum TaxID=4803 RepID=A0AAV2Z460_9STRA|nr:TPA: hypothetical protein N0F65_000534 [Lagenidium giganteum]